MLVSRVALPPHRRDPGAPAALRHDIAEGFRWVRHHAAVRTLVLTIFTFNITFGAAWSVLVLYATERLGLGDVGFGLVTTVSAVGGLVGTASYGWITRRVSLGDLMRIGLIVETLTHLALALTTSPWVAMPVFFVFGAHAFVWGTTSVTVRQRAVPMALQGRVGSVNLVGVYGGLVIGSAIGGVLAQHCGLAAPFWFAFVGSAVFVVLIWRQLAPHRPRRRAGRSAGRRSGRRTLGWAPWPRPAARTRSRSRPTTSGRSPWARSRGACCSSPLLVAYPRLDDDGRGSWVWIAAAGFGLGLLGVRHVRRRRAALSRATQPEGETSDGTPPGR